MLATSVYAQQQFTHTSPPKQRLQCNLFSDGCRRTQQQSRGDYPDKPSIMLEGASCYRLLHVPQKVERHELDGVAIAEGKVQG